jgi:hypothetical protein
VKIKRQEVKTYWGVQKSRLERLKKDGHKSAETAMCFVTKNSIEVVFRKEESPIASCAIILVATWCS